MRQSTPPIGPSFCLGMAVLVLVVLACSTALARAILTSGALG